MAHGVTLGVHAVPALALASFVRPETAIAVALVIWLGTALRLYSIAWDKPRPQWIVRLVDVPMFWHWGGALFASLAFVPAAIGALALGVALPHAALAAYALGLVVSAYGVTWRRWRVVVREIEVAIDGLPAAFDGYRVAQLSDLHIGSYDRVATGARWARLALAARPDLIVVTGDLVTSGTAFNDDAAEVVGKLAAPDGVFVVLGNHDQWDAPALEAAIARRGPTVLANAWRSVERGGARLVVAGIDDRFTKKADLDRTLAGRPDGVPTLLLSHYPDFFEDAARRGVALTLSGHTHGGQIGFGDRMNLATLSRQRPRGLFRAGASALYVNAGLGTTGPPLRLGVPPEIAVLVLRDSGSMRGGS